MTGAILVFWLVAVPYQAPGHHGAVLSVAGGCAMCHAQVGLFGAAAVPSGLLQPSYWLAMQFCCDCCSPNMLTCCLPCICSAAFSFEAWCASVIWLLHVPPFPLRVAASVSFYSISTPSGLWPPNGPPGRRRRRGMLPHSSLSKVGTSLAIFGEQQNLWNFRVKGAPRSLEEVINRL